MCWNNAQWPDETYQWIEVREMSSNVLPHVTYEPALKSTDLKLLFFDVSFIYMLFQENIHHSFTE